MALDANLELYDANVNINANSYNVQGNWINLGRAGLPSGAQFYVSLQTPAVDRDVYVSLEGTLDNNATSKEMCRFKIPKTFGGVYVKGIEEDFNVQEYASANVDVRVNIWADNHANVNNVGYVKAYIATGEKPCHGRLPTADTLEV